MRKLIIIITLLAIIASCENKSINEGEEFRPKEIHEKIDYHFDNITVDGIEYLILSRDNNNPHEGFGFMAFRANALIQKQDSILSYLQVMSTLQTEMYARSMNIGIAESQANFDSLFLQALNQKASGEEIARNTYSSLPRK